MPKLFPFVGISLRPQKNLPILAQISHFLVTSQIRSKDALSLLHQLLAVWVSVCLATKISRYTQRLLSMMQSLSPPSYMVAWHGSNTVVMSGYWCLFASDVSSWFLDIVGGTRWLFLKLDLGLGFHTPSSPAPQVWPRYQNISQQTVPLRALWPTKTRQQECWWTKEAHQGSHEVDPKEVQHSF